MYVCMYTILACRVKVSLYMLHHLQAQVGTIHARRIPTTTQSL